MEKDYSRRKWLKTSAGVISALAGSTVFTKALAETCNRVLTPEQTSGPFYPEDLSGNNDNDLTTVSGRSGVAEGEIIQIEGRVVDQNCEPVSGAIVDLWQANKHGRYDHSLDVENPEPLDPNFQNRGIAITDSKGRYNFKTIIPGHYPATNTWIRPAHLHFKISRRGYRELITQMYFEGTPYLAEDRILQSLSAEERANVIVRLEEKLNSLGEKQKVGFFEIKIQKF